jgi:hypothetical protein
MIWYRLAKVEPVVSSFFDVSAVLVMSISLVDGSFVPHFPQKEVASGFSAPHLGHWMVIKGSP